jgi:hypothetical protein
VKGLKGKYDGLVNWVQDVYSHARHLNELFIDSELNEP